jgi:hypothetical protein
LFVGTSGIAGTAEVWRYSGSGSTWTKVGGDDVNGSWDNTNFENVLAMESFSEDGKLYVGLGISTNDGEVWACTSCTTSPSWVRTRAFSGIEEVVAMDSTATDLYVGTGSTAGDGDFWRFDGVSTWTQIGGDGLNSSWAAATYERVRDIKVSGSVIYVGIGDSAANEAEVWRCSNCQATPTWTKVGGDGVNSSWNTNYETVSALAVNGTTVYAGIGVTASDAEVYQCTSCDGVSPAWTKIGGDTANNWNTGYENVRGLVYLGSTLYAGLGDTANEAEVWRYSGSGDTWTKVGGDKVNTTWDQWNAAAASVKEQAIVGVFGSDLIAGLGTTQGDAEVWRCASCSTSPSWSWIAGRDFFSWGAQQLAIVNAVTVNDGKLYIGTGSTNKMATVWQFDGTTWTQIGGGALNGSWDETIENVRSLGSLGNKLYAGLGDTAGDADVYEWNGSAWSKIGGDAVNSSWTAGT